MKISRRVLARYIATELSSGKSRASVIEALAAYVVVNRLSSQLDLILADIAANLARLGYIEANVTTARPIDGALKAELLEFVKKMENAENVTLAEHLDPAILGGVIIETPRKRFDASVATKLKRLRNA